LCPWVWVYFGDDWAKRRLEEPPCKQFLAIRERNSMDPGGGSRAEIVDLSGGRR